MDRRALLYVAFLAASCAIGEDWDVDSGEPAEPPTAAGAIEGTCTDTSGASVSGVAVATSPRGVESTCEQGAFSIPRIAPGTYRIVAAGPGWETTETDEFSVEDASTASVSVVLEPAAVQDGVLRVHVLGPDDLPFVGAEVTAESGGAEIGFAETDADGWAELVDLGGETVDVVLEADALWGRTWEDVVIPELGGVQLDATLAGRPADNADYVGSELCSFCHGQAVTHAAGAHGQALGELSGDVADAFAAGADVDLGNGATAVVSGTSVSIVATSGDSIDLDVAGLIGANRKVPWAVIGDQGYPLPIVWIPEASDRTGYPDSLERFEPYEIERWIDSDGELVLNGDGRPDPSLSAEAQCFGCHASAFEATPRLDGGVDFLAPDGSDRWLDAFVGCERCHGPGSTHLAASTDDKPWTITNPSRLDPARSEDVCAQCHSRRLGVGTGVPWALSDSALFRPGETLADVATSDTLLWPSGAAAAPHQQADEIALAAHGGLLRCYDCHAPHAEGTDGQGDALPASLRLESRDNSLCLSCHEPWTFVDEDAVKDHANHFTYDPEGEKEGGRCTSCHMPKTASASQFSAESGAGELSSHLFQALSPEETLDAFAGEEKADLGSFPVHACADCHGWNAWSAEAEGGFFVGPFGDPTQASTVEAFVDAFEYKFP